MNPPDLTSLRSRKARTAARFGKRGEHWLSGAYLFLAPIGVSFLLRGGTRRVGFLGLAVAAASFILARWYRRDLKDLPPEVSPKSFDGVMEADFLASFKKGQAITPRAAWERALGNWQGVFVTQRLLLRGSDITGLLGEDSSATTALWQKSLNLTRQNQGGEIGAGALCAALLTDSPAANDYLAKLNLRAEDVIETYSWVERLNRYFKQARPHYGGIGRDWATGFTPNLDRFGENISRAVESGSGHFHTLAHANIQDSVIYNLSKGSGSVALVGEAGTGKTALVYALAERLLEGRDNSLRYYQIVSLNASLILSSAKDELENIIMGLLGEAVRAGNIIIFLDEARLFFGHGVGAFDMGQILMPILKNRSIKVLAAFTPNDYQRLKTENEALAADLAVVSVVEPDEALTMDILEDTALTIGQRDDVMISYQAVREAYRLSGQYFQEMSYPGKAINLLEQTVPFASDKVITADSVEAAVEKIKGVKVTKAQGSEADVLLHLEAKIHARMINQERAVSLVSAALRRGRAGVANPKRPVGSFLFLGPTGVGKTELARSLAATYFGDEKRMIRLDMTEYQQPEDIHRLLDNGATDSKNLIISIREQPFSVVLLDEIEKAHPNILNLLLQILDEGQLTDQSGKPALFRSAILICTSNAGSAEITEQLAHGGKLDDFERPLIDDLIRAGLFKPELINRFDEIVLFRPLDQKEISKVAGLMLDEVNKTLSSQNVRVGLTQAALEKIAQAGYDPQFGARSMRRVIQKMVEDTVAAHILNGQAQPGSIITLDVGDLGPLL